MQILTQVESGAYTIEEVDAITGPALGRPKSATFRTLDIAGLDVLAHVVHNLYERLPDEAARSEFALPPFVEKMIERDDRREGRPGLLQARKIRVAASSRDPDARSGDARVPSAQAARASPRSTRRAASPTSASASARCSTARTRSASSCGRRSAPTLVYTGKVTPEIAHSPDDVDRVMRWGFGWELGPFELIVDAAARTSQGARVHAEVPPSRAATSSSCKSAKDRNPRRQEERRRQPRRSRRRRAVRRVPLEDERDRRRHDPDAAGRRARRHRRTSPRSSSATRASTSRPAPT